MEIKMTKWPTEDDWVECKRRALCTAGFMKVITLPSTEWKEAMLNARHSPIRCLTFSFDLVGIPSWVSVHLVRHVHAQPYVQSQRNDRQDEYDRTEAPQDSPVNMIWDMNAEELMTIANKRLCAKASPETRDIVKQMCDLVVEKCPEFKPFLVEMCKYAGCHEYDPCGKGESGAIATMRKFVHDCTGCEPWV